MGQADWEATAQRLQQEAPRFVGLTEDEATALAAEVGAQIRMGQIFTMDYRPDRITAVTEDGRVVSAQVG
jgi:hypothetical protein